MGQQDVLPHLVDEGPPTETTDAVAGGRTQYLGHDRHDDHHCELQRLAFAGNLAAGQDTPVDQRDLGTDG